MQAINDILIKTIETIVDRKLEERKKKQTSIRPSSIVGLNEDGTYKIILDGNTYNVPCSLGIELRPCQNVWLMIPHGRMEWMHICGVCKGTEIATTSGGINSNVLAHIKNNNIHVTAEEKETWNSLADNIADLLYKQIEISNFSITPSLAQYGTTVDQVTCSWGFNKTPNALTLNNDPQDINSTSITLTGLSLTANKSYTLAATDERDASATSTKTLQFCNYIMYGIATISNGGLTIVFANKRLSTSHLSSFSVTAGINEYIFYAIPSRFAQPYFNCGGFDGGITLFQTVENQEFDGSDYAEPYDYYVSDYHSLGTQTFNVRTTK